MLTQAASHCRYVGDQATKSPGKGLAAPENRSDVKRKRVAR
jgi:hypothetical protein